jgi:large subunit ribosomal protein L18e
MSKIRKMQVRKTNPNLIRLIDELLESSVKNDAKIWREIAEMLSKPKRKQAEVNISKIQRYSKEGETIIVPGKVLGTGNISKPVTVSALAFSERAREKIESAGGKCIDILQLVRENPKGSGVRIMV